MNDISDQAAKNNHDQKIGHDDIDNYFDSENSDYQLETGLQCRCGTELTGADHEGKDYVWGGRAVQVESFIKKYYYCLVNLFYPQTVSGQPVSLGGVVENNEQQRIFNLWRNTGGLQVHHHCRSLCAWSLLGNKS